MYLIWYKHRWYIKVSINWSTDYICITRNDLVRYRYTLDVLGIRHIIKAKRLTVCSRTYKFLIYSLNKHISCRSIIWNTVTLFYLIKRLTSYNCIYTKQWHVEYIYNVYVSEAFYIKKKSKTKTNMMSVYSHLLSISTTK